MSSKFFQSLDFLKRKLNQNYSAEIKWFHGNQRIRWKLKLNLILIMNEYN